MKETGSNFLNDNAMKANPSFIIPVLFLMILLLPSCSKEKADITVHYYLTNASDYDLRIRTSKSITLDLPVQATGSITDVTEGIDYHGSCSFSSAFEEGCILTITYEDKEYDYDMTRSTWGFKDIRSYKVHKDAPREFTAEYTIYSGEIVEHLVDLGVIGRRDDY